MLTTLAKINLIKTTYLTKTMKEVQVACLTITQSSIQAIMVKDELLEQQEVVILIMPRMKQQVAKATAI